MKLSQSLSQETLKQLLDYDELTGVFRWKVARGNKTIGSIAGYVTWHGYVEIKINRKTYWAHRLVWLFVHGSFPKDQIDHIDCDRKNNSLSNLREATVAQNSHNKRDSKRNKTGFRGVSKSGSKYVATISINGTHRHIGTFDKPEIAYEAYVKAKRINHEFCTL